MNYRKLIYLALVLFGTAAFAGPSTKTFTLEQFRNLAAKGTQDCQSDCWNTTQTEQEYEACVGSCSGGGNGSCQTSCWNTTQTEQEYQACIASCG